SFLSPPYSGGGFNNAPRINSSHMPGHAAHQRDRSGGAGGFSAVNCGYRAVRVEWPRKAEVLMEKQGLVVLIRVAGDLITP
ncbi:hypothetical protein, partial [Nonomuraea sp. MG754425]|uniref:hypothetical protein n=1 Tax=Nonomuraea sp. MG754425 TaxID=2570319 RepID=UPI001F2ECF90